MSAVEVVRNEVVDGKVRATDDTETFEAGLVVRAIGYSGEPIPGLPFDEDAGTVPHEAGRVMLGDEPVRGSYVAGWIKRGPTGVIGTNKSDGAETAASVIEDLDSLPAPAHPEPEAVVDRLREYGIEPVDWDDWLRLDAAEIRLGAERGGTDRVKIADRDEMLEAARSAESRTA